MVDGGQYRHNFYNGRCVAEKTNSLSLQRLEKQIIILVLTHNFLM